MNRTVLDAWVGIFVAVGIGALFFLALKVGNASDSVGDIYRVSAEFENIGGLKVRAPVKSAGVVVGRVSDIQFDAKKRSEEHTSELQSQFHLVCRLLLEKKNKKTAEETK